MKRIMKTLICCILALVIMLLSVSAAFAKNDVTPVIFIHGWGATALYKNPGTEEEESVEGFNISCLLGSGGLLSQLLTVARGQNVSSDDIIDAFVEFMSPYQEIACDKNGNSTNNIGIKSYWTDSLANHTDYGENASLCKQIADKIGAENVYAFNYDWRLDACENAKTLSSFIDGVKAQTGKSKVTLIAGSEGTVVVSAYIDAYKSKNDLKRTVFLNGALCGVNVTKLFKQDIIFDKDIVLEYLRQICVTYNNKDTSLTSLRFFVGLLDESLGNLCDYLNVIVNNPALLNRVYNEVLAPLATLPALWEFIPYDDFNACVSKMSQIGLLDKSSGLYSKISHYHQVQGRLESNIKALKNKGVEIAVIANYGTPAIPVTSAYAEQTDILIDTTLASIGATVADYGSTLENSGKYVSADKIIDASTCLLPDSTWFIKGIQHMDFWYGTEATDFVAEITTTDAAVNISSIENSTGIGQFIGTDSNQNIVDVTKTGSSSSGITTQTTAAQSEMKSPLTGKYTVMPAALTALAAVGTALTLFKTVQRKKAKKSQNR